ncbi:MAG: sugar nucleotide-binding protein [Actinomycetota bacterium]
MTDGSLRLLVTGASGFVGSNIVEACRRLHGDELITDRVDLLDATAIADHVTATTPDGVIHSAIINDWDAMVADRRTAWAAYVDSTKAYAEACDRAGIPFVLVSTDWVYDGTQGPAPEDEPPNPVNPYGFLKAASELVALDRNGSVARVSGVNGSHWGGREVPRAQDHGFGYFVSSLVDTLGGGKPFHVWEGDGLVNTVASPSLGTMCGEVMRGVVAERLTGVFHCCGADAVSRRQLARTAVEVFELDGELLTFGPPPEVAPMPIPADTSLDATASARRLGYRLPSITELLSAYRRERSDGTVTPFVTT